MVSPASAEDSSIVLNVTSYSETEEIQLLKIFSAEVVEASLVYKNMFIDPEITFKDISSSIGILSDGIPIGIHRDEIILLLGPPSNTSFYSTFTLDNYCYDLGIQFDVKYVGDVVNDIFSP
jgi:hypothetical protein